MEFIQIKQNCYYFQSAVNIGYIQCGQSGLLIDAGIDKQTMKKVLNVLSQHDLPVTHLFVTHAHADHYGGASYLQSVEKVYTYAPTIEAAILRNPILEPLYLFQGNNPLQEMRNKFLEGKPIRVDQEVEEGKYDIADITIECFALPGHSIHQLGVLINCILYAADSYFSVEQLNKHKIPFIIDAQETLQSLHKVKGIHCKGAVPGHGVFEETFIDTVDANIAYHHQIVNSLEKILDECGVKGIRHDDMIKRVCAVYKVNELNISTWMLFRTAITAYLTLLVKDGKAELFIEEYTLLAKSTK